jgi:membrane-associated protease RseP (regulator of RpoE activity)
VGSVEIAGISDTALQANPQLLLEGLSYGVSLIAILGVHELGHYLTAQFYKIKATLPYFIPIPFFLGTLGAYIQIRSPIPNRKVLFDLNVAGPIAGFLITVPLLIWGLAHSAIVPLEESSGIFSIHSFNPSFSFLLTLLSKIALGGQLTLDKALDLHPVAVAGCVGLMVTALNLIPVGSLDGGHIVHAMFGQRTGIAIGQISRFLLLLLSFIHREFLFLVILLFFLPLNNEPALNDVSELDNKRDLVGLLMLILLAGILLPTPKAVIQLLF